MRFLVGSREAIVAPCHANLAFRYSPGKWRGLRNAYHLCGMLIICGTLLSGLWLSIQLLADAAQHPPLLPPHLRLERVR